MNRPHNARTALHYPATRRRRANVGHPLLRLLVAVAIGVGAWGVFLMEFG